jgi:hypothetical protein
MSAQLKPAAGTNEPGYHDTAAEMIRTSFGPEAHVHGVVQTTQVCASLNVRS